MRHAARWFIASAALLMQAGSSSADDGSSALPLIEINTTADGIEIVASVLGLSPATVTGRMSIDRHGSGGVVTTSQSREFTLEAGETADIARTGVSFSAGDALEVVVVVEQDGRRIGEASMRSFGR